MKKRLSLLLVLLLIPLIAFSEDTPHITVHYSLSADFRPYSTGKGGSSFESDALLIDLYFTDSDVVYLWSCECIGGTYLVSGFNERTVVERDGILYLVNASGYYHTAWYDENGTDLWLNYNDHSFRLHPVPSFSFYEDWQ